MLAVVNTKSLIFGADEDSRDDVASNKDNQEPIVVVGIAQSVEDSEKDKPSTADKCESNGEA